MSPLLLSHVSTTFNIFTWLWKRVSHIPCQKFAYKICKLRSRFKFHEKCGHINIQNDVQFLVMFKKELSSFNLCNIFISWLFGLSKKNCLNLYINWGFNLQFRYKQVLATWRLFNISAEYKLYIFAAHSWSLRDI